MSDVLCKYCKKIIIGRADKIFCSIDCKNKYHRGLSHFVSSKTLTIDKILHRNRAILQELLGKKKVQIKVNRLILSKKKFHFKYHTHFYVNKSRKVYYHIYDIAWMEFSDDEILIVKR